MICENCGKDKNEIKNYTIENFEPTKIPIFILIIIGIPIVFFLKILITSIILLFF